MKTTDDFSSSCLSPIHILRHLRLTVLAIPHALLVV